MSKNKLAKFAEMATYPHVFQPAPDEPIDAPSPMRGRWHSDFFKNNHPIVLELGCGRGEYAVGLARRFPDKNFIGVDIKGARMWSGATTSLQENLKNVAFVRTRIEFIGRFFAPDEVSEIWLTFSDPQMKMPTKRLTSTYFMNRYRQFLIDGGLIHVKTDSRFLFTYTSCMVEENHLPIICKTDDLYSVPAREQLPDNILNLLQIQTYYEQQWLSRGITIKFISFCLPRAGELREPDVEIEFDSYRSFSRNKRSSLNAGK